MAVTPHDSEIGETYALPNGNNTWASILAALKPGMNLGHKRWYMSVESGGPVAVAKKAMAALTDGRQYNVGEFKEEPPPAVGRVINGAAINLFGSGNAVIYIEASNS